MELTIFYHSFSVLFILSSSLILSLSSGHLVLRAGSSERPPPVATRPSHFSRHEKIEKTPTTTLPLTEVAGRYAAQGPMDEKMGMCMAV